MYSIALGVCERGGKNLQTLDCDGVLRKLCIFRAFWEGLYIAEGYPLWSVGMRETLCMKHMICATNSCLLFGLASVKLNCIGRVPNEIRSRH